MKKEHKLRTITEILEVVNLQNLPVFLKDFNDWLTFTISFRAAAKELKDVAIECQDYMHWVDDGKNEKDITIRLK